MNDERFFQELVLKFTDEAWRFVGSDDHMVDSIVNKALAVYKKTKEAVKDNKIGYFEVKGADLVRELEKQALRKGGITTGDYNDESIH